MFKGIEVLTFAVEIEKNGKAFYNKVAQQVEDDTAKEIFLKLATEEEKHITDFEELMAGVSDYFSPESYEGEYLAYIKTLVDNHVFIQNADIDKLMEKVTDAKSAIDLALGFEKDSVLFFNELRNLITVHEQKTIDKLIAEERKHIQTLIQLKKKFSEC